MFYKTNSALGYQQYAYLLKLSDTEYVCCYHPSDSYYSYELGEIYDKSDVVLERVSKEEFFNTSNLHSTLLEYLIKTKK